MMDISGRIAVVTGGAQGIGRACAQVLHRHGARVVLADIDGGGLDAVRNELAPNGERLHCFAADLRAEATVTELFARIAEEIGDIDILVNNVGQGARERASSFRASKPETWDFLLDICLNTTIRCTHQVIAGMIDRGYGKIVNISSDSAFIGARASAVYAAAKGGVNAFTRSLAQETAAFGVTVNAVAPGYIQTRAMDLLPAELVERAIAETPMKKLGLPEDIANAALFFASDMSRFVTGQTLIVNGGRWMI